jgi:hypothetical protein
MAKAITDESLTEFASIKFTAFDKLHIKCKNAHKNKITKEKSVYYTTSCFWSYLITQIMSIERVFGNGFNQS